MSLQRRFIYLVVDGGRNRRRSCRDSYWADTFHMRRINMSRFFYPEPAAAAETAATVVDARLPRPCITFCASSPMHFMLLGRDKVLAMDCKGRTTMYDPGANSIRPAPTLTNPKSLPAISLPIGDSLYILDPKNSDDQCFEALVYKPAGRMDKYNDWHCQSLPPPPYVARSCSFVGAYGAIAAYAVVGGSDSDSAEIWVSTNDGDGGTFSFDTARRAWTNHGDWKLPFRGLAEYVPEYNLWFGLSNNNTNHLCAFDLAGTAKLQSPPPPRNFCKDFKPPKDWRPVSSYLVHLGSGRFCIARFFDKRVKIPGCCDCDIDMDTELYGVFTGVEVKAGRGLRMVKHSFVGAYGAIAAYAVVGGSDSDSAEIWVSTNDRDGGTFSFDTARRAWTNHGDWKLPFRGLAEYVPEYNLWFGLSNNNTNHLCAFDLAGTAKLQSPPPPRNFCKDFKPPKDWRPVSSYLVHLGSGRFCIARFFDKRVKIPGCCDCDIDMDTELYGVFTGVEVKAGRGLRMVKHRSECYRLDDVLRECVL